MRTCLLNFAFQGYCAKSIGRQKYFTRQGRMYSRRIPENTSSVPDGVSRNDQQSHVPKLVKKNQQNLTAPR